jgi:hypothetical protein
LLTSHAWIEIVFFIRVDETQLVSICNASCRRILLTDLRQFRHCFFFCETIQALG